MVPELNGQGADYQVARGQKLPSRERNKSEIYQKNLEPGPPLEQILQMRRPTPAVNI